MSSTKIVGRNSCATGYRMLISTRLSLASTMPDTLDTGSAPNAAEALKANQYKTQSYIRHAVIEYVFMGLDLDFF